MKKYLIGLIIWLAVLTPLSTEVFASQTDTGYTADVAKRDDRFQVTAESKLNQITE